MSLAKKQDITLNHGDNYLLDFEGPVSWADYDVWFTVKLASDAAENDTAAVIQKRYDPTGVATDAIYLEANAAEVANAKAVIALTPTDTETNTSPGVNYVYDLQVKDAGGNIYTLFEGNFKIAKAQVTWAN